MAPHILLVFLIFCSNSITLQKIEAISSMAIAADDQCQSKCGKKDIPYPFGTKEGCYINQLFQVTCNESTASLTWWEGEVDSISIVSHNFRYKHFEVVPCNDYQKYVLEVVVPYKMLSCSFLPNF
ncbi:hypothetical protein ACP275_08G128800 [Erythranthe tilingii]